MSIHRRAAILAMATAVSALGPASAHARADSSSATSATGGTTTLISVRADGSTPARPSWRASVTPDGRYVAFLSRAKGLDPAAGSPHRHTHVYLRDLQAATTTAIDVRPDGRFGKGTASYRDYPQYNPVSSDDGHLVAFASNARRLAPGGGHTTFDVFVRDLRTGTTTLESETSRGKAANSDCEDFALSADGSTIAFRSNATNLVPGKEHRRYHIYRRDLTSGEITLVSRTPTGDFPYAYSNAPSLSADGTLVAYESLGADDIVPGVGDYAYNVILYDATTDTSVLVSRPESGADTGSWGSDNPSISADGATVAYTSREGTLGPRDRNNVDDIYAYDVATRDQALISQTISGGQTNDDSEASDVATTGSPIVYASTATNIVPDDNNDLADVFSYDALTDTTTLRSGGPSGTTAHGNSDLPSTSADGSEVVFESTATDLVPGGRAVLQIYLNVIDV